MQILNKAQRIYTIQVGKKSVRLAPLATANVEDNYGLKLINLYPDELVNITAPVEKDEEPQKAKAKKKANNK